ncbi:MAG: putative LPS assembly protein LptD [Thermodesulfovibrionales bacterium]|nr:putative LPS assembly protein LptD [Thermodesulfovibrionales bacterium]
MHRATVKLRGKGDCRKGGRAILSVLIFFILLFFTKRGLSVTLQENEKINLTYSPYSIEISARELSEKKGIYSLKGDVKIKKSNEDGESLIQSEEVIYNSLTQEAELKENVYYEDSSMTIKAERARLNLKEKTGILYNAEIVFKKEFFRLITPEVQKLSEDHFIFKRATFTTCEGLVPDWCIKGRDVDFIRGNRVSAKDATFNIKGIPVFYTPYIWAPALTERKTGFLIPSISYNNRLGLELKLPFYIVLGENADTTLLLDLYTERGIGKAAEFRYRGLPGNYLDLMTYHIRDSRLEKDFYEIFLKQNLETSFLNDDLTEAGPFFREFISVHTVNEGFFETYNPFREVRLTRFLSSAGEISYLFKGRNINPAIRLFIEAGYWQDLQGNTSIVSQKLPEAGISLYPSGRDNFYYWLEARAGNFFREEGIRGQRLWFMPGIRYSTGKEFVLTQSLSLRGSYYWLHAPSGFQNNDNTFFISEIIYAPQLSTRIEKDYDSFQHIIESSIGYLRKEKLTDKKDLLVTEFLTEDFFDYRDIMERTSRVELEILNRFRFKDGEKSELIIKFSQPYDTFRERVLPLNGEASLRIKNFHSALLTEYDPEIESLKTFTLKAGLDLGRLRASVAERFSQGLDLFFLNSNIFYDISRSISLNSTVWYDLKGEGLRNLLLGASWKRQCWTLNIRYIKTPEDYSLLAGLELTGL